MKDNRFNWQVAQLEDLDFKQLAKATNLDPNIVKILAVRGLTTAEAISNFINDDASMVHDPFLLHDMQKAVDRIFTAVEADEKILIYGDYDADGVTSTTIMYETLDQIGANVQYFVPNRFKDGYGPNLAEYQHFINDEGIQLIITVDNGIAGNEAIQFAKDHDVDVIITDHHELPEQLPNAYATVHPRHPEGEYPFGDLSGVGVAFKVATALLEEIPEEFLDLYAIGTIADLVSMTDENRFLVKMGLQAIPNTQRIGLQKLIEISGVDATHFDEQDVGFTIAPRINAVGRLGDASRAVELLTTFDDEQAGLIAKEINDVNVKRQGLVSDIYEAAAKIALDAEHANRQTLVIAGHDWHQGVLGIVASRIVELTNKPTIVLSDQDHNEIYKGSGRSVEALNLFKAIDPVRESFVGFGGHHMAIGITVEGANLAVLDQQLEAAAVEAGLDAQAKPTLKIDLKIKIEEISETLINAIKTLGPFGNGNPIPKFELEQVNVKDAKAIGKDGSHLKFSAVEDQASIAAIAFKRGELSDVLNNVSNPISLAGTLNTNEWRGNITLQMMVDDLKIDGLQIVDQRTSNLNKNLFKHDTQYIFFNPKLMDLMESQNLNRQFYQFDSTEIKLNDTIVLVDCPDDLEQLSQVIQRTQPQQIVTYFFHQTDFYANGMPTRQEFKQVFGAVKVHQLTKADLNQLGQKLKIDQEKVNFMIKVFFELNFVKIENGLLSINEQVQQHQLSDASIYQKREKLIKTQGKLLYSNGDELAALLTQLIDAE
jgi:single-stranded-DNA-specific exonuclease